MAILITGAAGYIGSHAVWTLDELGEHTVALDNLSCGTHEALPPHVPFVEGDVGDEALMRRAMDVYGIDTVMHFAALSDVAESMTNESRYMYHNATASGVLFQAARDAGIKHIVFSSTAAVYGDPPTNPVAEDVVLNPASPYGVSKVAAEELLASHVNEAPDMTAVVLRYFNVAGADRAGRTGNRDPAPTHLIARACETALGERSYLEIYGTDYPTPDGTAVRDYIHVSDLVSAHVSALAYLRAGGPSVTLNCGYGRGYSVREVVNTVRQVSGLYFEVRERPRRAGDPTAVVADNSRIRETLDWEPHFDRLETIVDDELAWMRTIRIPR